MKLHRILSAFLLAALLFLTVPVPAAQALEDPDAQAKAALLIDMDTGLMLYGKNERSAQYPASITKVMVALLVFEAIERGDKAAIEDEVGDLFFAAVNVARLKKVDPDLALTYATDKFEKRFKLTEKLIREDGKSFDGMTLEEMDKYWDKAKELLD